MSKYSIDQNCLESSEMDFNQHKYFQLYRVNTQRVPCFDLLVHLHPQYKVRSQKVNFPTFIATSAHKSSSIGGYNLRDQAAGRISHIIYHWTSACGSLCDYQSFKLMEVISIALNCFI